MKKDMENKTAIYYTYKRFVSTKTVKNRVEQENDMEKRDYAAESLKLHYEKKGKIEDRKSVV